MTLTEELKSIHDQLQDAKISAVTVSVRDVLAWAGARRRGFHIVLRIRSAIRKAGLIADPSISSAWIDGTVDFEVRQQPAPTVVPKREQESSSREHDVESDSPSTNTNIGSFPPANAKPLSVKPDTTVEEIITHLMAHDYSQLPVMTNARTVKGMVSWRSIGSRLALKIPCVTASDCMSEAHVVKWEDSMFDAITEIERYDAVLVRNKAQKITGIITAADFSHKFKTLSEPFLLLGEIESLLRDMIDAKFKKPDLEASKFEKDDKREVNSAADLTFGEYIVLLENRDRWEKLALLFDRAAFIKKMNLLKDIRNEVMHFGPDPLEDVQQAMLRTFLKMLQALKSMNLIGSTS